MDTNPLPHARPPIYREDGWTAKVQEAFIVALIEHGSVQTAANVVDRHITSAYRLRLRQPAFASAWDAARRMAYARVRDEAMDRALNGTAQEVWQDGQWIGVKRVRSDALLIALLNHLKHETPPRALAPAGSDDIEDRRTDAAARALAMLAPPPSPSPSPPPPVRLRPARGRIVATTQNPLDLF